MLSGSVKSKLSASLRREVAQVKNGGREGTERCVRDERLDTMVHMLRERCKLQASFRARREIIF